MRYNRESNVRPRRLVGSPHPIPIAPPLGAVVDKRENPPADFRSEFLKHYLAVGMGSLGKRDIDALAMYLFDKYGVDASGPLAKLSNQNASVKLKTTVSRIRQLRYEAGLKYGGRVEDESKGRLLATLANASFDVESKKLHLIIEDVLTRNWLQGELKNRGSLFDGSFNSEIVKVDAEALFGVLEMFFDAGAIRKFREGYEKAKGAKNSESLRTEILALCKSFANGAAKTAGAAVAGVFATQTGMTPG